MLITTLHTLTFNIKCTGNEQQLAAFAIIKFGATTLGLTIAINGLPLIDGEDVLVRQSVILAACPNHEICENYWQEIERALTLIGVEVHSP